MPELMEGTELLLERDFLNFTKYFQFRANPHLTTEDRQLLSERIKVTDKNMATGGSYHQRSSLQHYGFYDQLIKEPHEYVCRIIGIIEEEEKRDFEKSRPPSISNKRFIARWAKIILSFMAAFYQSKREHWIEDKRITGNDLTGIAAACRAQIMLANRIAINRALKIFQAAKKFFFVVQRQMQNTDGYSKETLSIAHTIDLIVKDLRQVMIEKRNKFCGLAPVPQNQQQSEDDNDFSEDEFDEEDDESQGQRKQMSYSELVRNFSLHNPKIQQKYLMEKKNLEEGYDFHSFMTVRNVLAYHFLLSNSSRSEAVTYLQWEEVEQAKRAMVEKDPEDDFIMVPFHDHKNQGRGIHAKKPLYLGMDRWMLFDLTLLRSFCVPGNKFVFPSEKALKTLTKKGINPGRITHTVAKISGIKYTDHLHWIRSSATNASCISTEQSTSQMVPDMDLVILNGHSMKTAQKHYMRLDNNERCKIAARAYVKLAQKRRNAFNEEETRN